MPANHTFIKSSSMDQRLNALTNWLINSTAIELEKIEPASQDASFRRYFRAYSKSESETKQYIIMDAPPETERIQPFLDIAQQLAELGLHTPHVYQVEQELGFILLEDLGTRTYLAELDNNADTLYKDAISALVILQTSIEKQKNYTPPTYDSKLLQQEMDLFQQWYLEKHLDFTIEKASHDIWLTTQQFLINECLLQPQVWVHRDYHSRNLMITIDNSPGIIDFQDLVLGPIAYDLASLFKDCYIEWPRQRQLSWLLNYHNQLIAKVGERTFEFDQLVRWYDLSGLQRHLKVLGIFCRLNYRDNKPHYLEDLPLVAKYALDILPRYEELRDFDAHFGHLIERSL